MSSVAPAFGSSTWLPDTSCRSLPNTACCSLCGKAFGGRNRRQILERHLATHTGIKPYACPHCPKRSSRQDTLKVHINRVHRKLLNEEGSELFSAATSTVFQQPVGNLNRIQKNETNGNCEEESHPIMF